MTKRLQLLLLIFCILVSLSQAVVWNKTDTLSNGTNIYSTFSTGEITIAENNLCQCNYVFQWYSVSSGENAPLSTDTSKIQSESGSITFTSSASAYKDNGTWLLAVDKIAREHLLETHKYLHNQKKEIVQYRENIVRPKTSLSITLQDQ